MQTSQYDTLRSPSFRVSALLLAVLMLSCGRPGPDISGYEPRAGDLAFRRGGSTKSMAVLTADKNGQYSHVGIVVGTDSGFRVVHLAPGEREPGQMADTIKMETLERFFAPYRAERGELVRPGNDTAVCAAAARHALRLFTRRMLFDHRYDLADTAQMYCTEFVWYVYSLAGQDITQGRRSNISGLGELNGEHIFPSDIYKNPEIRRVYAF